MSNRVTIQPTKFEDTRTGETHLGIRVFDNYGQSYDNTWESIPDDDMDIITKVMESGDEVIVGILDSLHENGSGIFVGDVYYEWEQIKHLWGIEDEG